MMTFIYFAISIPSSLSPSSSFILLVFRFWIWSWSH